MTYSVDYRKQVLSNIADGMTIREVVNFYQLNTSSIHSQKLNLIPKTKRNKAPTKIPDGALIEDVRRFPDDYNYERACRLNCSKSGIEIALKRLGISQKKDLGTSKSVSDKKSGVSE